MGKTVKCSESIGHALLNMRHHLRKAEKRLWCGSSKAIHGERQKYGVAINNKERTQVVSSTRDELLVVQVLCIGSTQEAPPPRAPSSLQEVLDSD